MRITSGSKKGQSLITPKGQDIVRPALAKVREAIFSSLGDVTDFHIMDVFAGTGSLGFEALSRGAAHVTFIENHPLMIKCLIANAEKLSVSRQVTILKRQLPEGLSKVTLVTKPDIIFCDPPYDKKLVNSTIAALINFNFIDAKTTLIIEHSTRETPENTALGLVKQKKYGQTLVSFFNLKT